jgi:hypothetical protein
MTTIDWVYAVNTVVVILAIIVALTWLVVDKRRDK